MNRTDLIQTGTLAMIENGQVNYQAWYELLPSYPQVIPVQVHPGDTITASITMQSANSWTIALRDVTTGQSYQTNVNYSSSLSSAEWIEEAPKSASGPLFALDNFGSANFTNTWAIVNSQMLTPAQASARPITITNAYGDILAQASPLDMSGASFTVSRIETSLAVMQNPAQNMITAAPAQFPLHQIGAIKIYRAAQRVPKTNLVATRPRTFHTDGFAVTVNL